MSLISAGSFPSSTEWLAARAKLHQAIRNVEWPAGSGTFTIPPGPHLNGVTPIKDGLIAELQSLGWKKEQPLKLPPLPAGSTASKPGPLDATLVNRHHDRHLFIRGARASGRSDAATRSPIRLSEKRRNGPDERTRPGPSGLQLGNALHMDCETGPSRTDRSIHDSCGCSEQRH